MKKLILLSGALLFVLCSLQAQNDKIVGEKSKAIVGEKSVNNAQANKAAIVKMKNELERYYADYLKKQTAAENAANALRKKLGEAMKSMEANGKLGNFEIQRLMSEFNQAETLASQVLKKREETKKSVVSKL